MMKTDNGESTSVWMATADTPLRRLMEFTCLYYKYGGYFLPRTGRQ
jgi:hypothetical protein